MTISFKKISICMVALILGWTCGYLIHRALPDARETNAADYEGAVSPNTKISERTYSSVSASPENVLWHDEFVSRKSSLQMELEEYEQIASRPYRESRSPLRNRSLLSSRIQNSGFEKWEILLGEGRVTRLEVLDEVGSYLAGLDPERALRLYLEGSMKFENLDQRHAFRDAMIETLAKSDPLIVMNTLKSIDRGGTQQDNSVYFSNSWAKIDPKAAADHFSDLIYLRNMDRLGSEKSRMIFASQILYSWSLKDAEEAEVYVFNLPDGPKQKAFVEGLEDLHRSGFKEPETHYARPYDFGR